MRILIASQYYRPAYSFGGTVTTAVAQAEGLARMGHNVSVATTTRQNLETRPPRRSRTENVSGVTVHYLGTWWSFRKSNLNPGVIKFLLPGKFDFDVLHIIGLYDSLGPFLASVAAWRKVPYSIELSGMLIAGKRTVFGKRLYHQFVGRRFLSGAKAVMVSSRKELDEAVRFGLKPEQMVLKRHGVDISKFQCAFLKGKFRQRWDIPVGEPLILWLGRIDPIKNLEQLLAAMSELTNLPWRLAVIGPSETSRYSASLRELANQLGLKSRVWFVPPLYGLDKLAAFADADLLTLVSLSENWGHSVLEAIAAGVPVLVTKTCGVSLVIEHGGGLVIPIGIDFIREGLRRLLVDSKFYEQCKSELPAIAATMSWDEPLINMVNLFEDWKRQG